MYIKSPSGNSVSFGITPAPMDTACNTCITLKPSPVGSLLTPYPDFFPLQYNTHIGSSTIFVFSPGFFSHSRAILTSPIPISWRSFPVGIPSSRTSMGRHLGLSWITRLTLALRHPNRVPVIRVPPWRCPSPIRFPWSETGILHEGDMIGNDRKTARKRRKSFLGLDGPFLVDGWREICGGVFTVGVVGLGFWDHGDDTGSRGGGGCASTAAIRKIGGRY
ncbi:hypothetical protein DVH24_015904 [Malus domestica]|uniref:Uncharacterized protein n=1 Tax=Malus domestica TaxID=3750 RepID=A0A498JGA1_MALDO|nr:hypothetical protein DVH24_015904 [Malus domestica]